MEAQTQAKPAEPPSGAPEPEPTADGRLNADISNAMAALYSKHYGRGPTKARTHITHDSILCVLEEVYTPVERTLVEKGDVDAVKTVRSSFQRAMQEAFVGEVERLTGRKVRAFMSESHIDPDLAVEIFILEPDSASPKGEHEAAAR